jgi:hypothetical protein
MASPHPLAVWSRGLWALRLNSGRLLGVQRGSRTAPRIALLG